MLAKTLCKASVGVIPLELAMGGPFTAILSLVEKLAVTCLAGDWCDRYAVLCIATSLSFGLLRYSL